MAKIIGSGVVGLVLTIIINSWAMARYAGAKFKKAILVNLAIAVLTTIVGMLLTRDSSSAEAANNGDVIEA